MQVGLPVALAPLALGESWTGTPLGGAVIAFGLVGVIAGVALLSGSRPVGRLASTDADHEDPECGPGPEPARSPAGG
jgi:hypothetical protein